MPTDLDRYANFISTTASRNCRRTDIEAPVYRILHFTQLQEETLFRDETVRFTSLSRSDEASGPGIGARFGDDKRTV